MIEPVESAEVAAALADGCPVVALESTIFSPLGLPSPANAEVLDRCIAAIRAGGAVPALTAVLDGVARVGVSPDEHGRMLGPARKAAERDLAVALAQRWPLGATTVSASLALAAAVGISVFATGGIGGVHRGVEVTGDVSADLDAIAHHPLVTVCAGAKVFLDLARTLEHLETAGVPVLGWRHDWFPAFHSRSSGLPVTHRVATAAEVAAVLAHRSRPETGVLLTVPIPCRRRARPGRARRRRRRRGRRGDLLLPSECLSRSECFVPGEPSRSTRMGRNTRMGQRLWPSSSPLRRTVTGPSSLTTITVAWGSSKL